MDSTLFAADAGDLESEALTETRGASTIDVVFIFPYGAALVCVFVLAVDVADRLLSGRTAGGCPAAVARAAGGTYAFGPRITAPYLQIIT